MKTLTRFVLPLFFLLGACHQEKPQPIIQTVYCITPEQYKKIVDANPGSLQGNYTGQAQKDFILSTNQNVLLRIYANGLLKILGDCTSPAPVSA